MGNYDDAIGNFKIVCGCDYKDPKDTEKASLSMQFTSEKTTDENKKAKILSGGWQRRLSIAVSLVSKPKILFLDEPTLGLDVLARRELWKIIKSLKDKMTIILTTHYMEEAESLSDRIGIMKDGNLLFVGNKEVLLKETNSKNVEEAFISIVAGGIDYE